MSNLQSAHAAIPELDRKGLREFGLVTGAILVVLFGLLIPWVFDFGYPRWPWYIAGALAALAIIVPTWLGPVYYVWMRFGLLMSKIMTPLVLGIVFFLVITPVALFMKLISRDAMARSLKKEDTTYRVEREEIAREQIERPY
ncbi:MAG: sxtJ [Gammaproteobacteria bacterium]|nr:sxtJ [Gammaproteobacteria bacterium]